MKLFLKLGTAIALISGAVPALALDNSSSQKADMTDKALSLIHISEPTRP